MMSRAPAISYGEINLTAVQRNLATVAAHSRLPVYCVVKANAYGHGAEQVVAALGEHPACAGFAVARVEEALAIKAGPSSASSRVAALPLICLGTFLAGRTEREQRELLRVFGAERVEPVLICQEDIEVLLAMDTGVLAKLDGVHICFDTGMNREGITTESVASTVSRLRARGLGVRSLFSHFSESEVPDSMASARQIRRFESTLSTLPANQVPPVHLANSAGALGSGDSPTHPGDVNSRKGSTPALASPTRDAAVRVGGALYGLDLRSGSFGPKLEPAMSICSRLVQLRSVSKGEAVGYNGKWAAPRESLIGVVAMGYADGLGPTPPALGWLEMDPLTAKPYAMHRTPVVGTVSMDLTAVDLTDVMRTAGRAPRVGDTVVVLGNIAEVDPDAGGEVGITAAEHAEAQGTSLYSVTVGFSQRLPMRYSDARAEEDFDEGV